MGNIQSETELLPPVQNPDTYRQIVRSLEEVIINLDEDNIIESVGRTINFVTDNFTSFPNTFLSRFIYSAYFSQAKDINIYINFMKEMENQMKKFNSNECNLINTFTDFILQLDTQESYFLLEKLIDLNIFPSTIIENKKTFFFSHFMSLGSTNILMKNESIRFQSYFTQNLGGLFMNDWELHKQLIKEGHNPNTIAKIIRNDEIEKLQEISSQNDFDYNQTIKPSLYEKHSLINQKNVTLIDYAAFFGSINCFKYLLINSNNLENLGKYAVAGGNEEIIHLCEQNDISLNQSLEIAIEYHRNDIFKYIYENKTQEISNLEKLGNKCYQFCNFEIFSFLILENMKIDEKTMNDIGNTGNILLMKYLFEYNMLPKNYLIFLSDTISINIVGSIFMGNNTRSTIRDRNIYFFY